MGSLAFVRTTSSFPEKNLFRDRLPKEGLDVLLTGAPRQASQAQDSARHSATEMLVSSLPLMPALEFPSASIYAHHPLAQIAQQRLLGGELWLQLTISG